MERPKILVAVPNMGMIRAELAFNFLQWVSDQRFDTKIIAPQNLRPIPSARNFIANSFMEIGYDYLLMIDADMSGPPNLLELAHYDKDIVGALCFMMKEEGPLPLVMDKYKHGYRVPETMPANSLFEVDATGTGCIMIKRQVFEALEHPYFEYVLGDQGTLDLGQDFYFCRKAQAAGFKIYVHSGYVASHYCTVELAKIFNMTRPKQEANQGHLGQGANQGSLDPWSGVELVERPSDKDFKLPPIQAIVPGPRSSNSRVAPVR